MHLHLLPPRTISNELCTPNEYSATIKKKKKKPTKIRERTRETITDCGEQHLITHRIFRNSEIISFGRELKTL
jgi:hypothetical protein